MGGEHFAIFIQLRAPAVSHDIGEVLHPVDDREFTMQVSG